MKRVLAIAVLTLAALGVRPSPAAADLTAFLGLSPTPTTRSVKGFAVGIGLVIVGFEFEFAKTAEDDLNGAPRLTTNMFNAQVMTPTSGVQLYATAGAGIYREGLLNDTTTSVGTNIGGGVKLGLAGPIRLRLDYRIFSLRSNPRYKNPQRFYAGLNVSF